jgi:hypothetical protein
MQYAFWKEPTVMPIASRQRTPTLGLLPEGSGYPRETLWHVRPNNMEKENPFCRTSKGLCNFVKIFDPLLHTELYNL